MANDKIKIVAMEFQKLPRNPKKKIASQCREFTNLMVKKCHNKHHVVQSLGKFTTINQPVEPEKSYAKFSFSIHT